MLSPKFAELKDAVLAERAKTAEKSFHAYIHDQVNSDDVAAVEQVVTDLKALMADQSIVWEQAVQDALATGYRRFYELSV